MVDSTFFVLYLQATVNGTLRLSLHYLFIVHALNNDFTVYEARDTYFYSFATVSSLRRKISTVSHVLHLITIKHGTFQRSVFSKYTV